MRVKNETEYQILNTAEKILDTQFNWNINDDDFIGWCDEDEYTIIADLCSEIDRLNETIEEQKEYYENQIRDFYKPKSLYEVYGVNEGMFH